MAQSRSAPSFPTTDVSSEMRKKQNQEQQPLDLGSLPEGPLVEILSRVPYRSTCRFKCVSKPWLALCSAPDIRKRPPQALSGFFFYKHHRYFSFHNLSGRGSPIVDPSLPFLRKSYRIVIPRHCCAGLVLCRFWKSYPFHKDECNLLVCNPATEMWTKLPPSPIELSNEGRQYLGFDPADTSRFVVFAHQREFKEVAIYSSDTGQWTVVQSGWIDGTIPVGRLDFVFLNGTMHLMTAKPSIVTVDTEGKVWREIDIPGNVGYADPSIGQSQGRLYAWYIDDDNPNICQLSVWALEDYGTGGATTRLLGGGSERGPGFFFFHGPIYLSLFSVLGWVRRAMAQFGFNVAPPLDYGSAKWTLKHTVNILELFGRHCCNDDEFYKMFAIHPDRNLIFLTDGKRTTISYDMDNREVHVIGTSEELSNAQPYVPCFAEWPSDGQ